MNWNSYRDRRDMEKSGDSGRINDLKCRVSGRCRRITLPFFLLWKIHSLYNTCFFNKHSSPPSPSPSSAIQFTRRSEYTTPKCFFQFRLDLPGSWKIGNNKYKERERDGGYIVERERIRVKSRSCPTFGSKILK